MLDSYRASACAVLFFAGALGACADGGRSEAEAFRPLTVPAGPTARAYNLTQGADGGLLLSWLEVAGDTAILRYSTLASEAWSDPVEVSRGTGWFVNWADRPRVGRLPDGALVASWLVNRNVGVRADYSYGLEIAYAPEGSTWRTIHRPLEGRLGLDEYTGFLSFLWDDEELLAAYLAPAEPGGADPPTPAAGHELEHPMAVRLASFSADGSLRSDTVLDSTTCSCCPLSMASAPDGPIVVYRDRTAEEVRDIAIVRRVDGKWTEPRMVHQDGWVIPGCPVNGPAVAADGSRVVVAWMTAPGGQPEVRFAASADGGESFGSPVRVDQGNPVGYAGAVLFADGSAGVSWVEHEPGTDAPELLFREVAPDGTLGPVSVIGQTTGGRSAGMPEMARSGDLVVLVWKDGETLRSAMLAGAE